MLLNQRCAYIDLVLAIEREESHYTHPTFLHILKKFFCNSAFVFPRVVISQQLESYCGSIICISDSFPLTPFVWSCTSTSLFWWKFKPTTPLSSVTYIGSSFLPQFNVACNKCLQSICFFFFVLYCKKAPWINIQKHTVHNIIMVNVYSLAYANAGNRR